MEQQKITYLLPREKELRIISEQSKIVLPESGKEFNLETIDINDNVIDLVLEDDYKISLVKTQGYLDRKGVMRDTDLILSKDELRLNIMVDSITVSETERGKMLSLGLKKTIK